MRLCKLFPVAIVAVLILSNTAPRALSQDLRVVRDNTIISTELPKADLTFGPAFHYAGGQNVNLYGMANAEQHLFVKPGNNGGIDTFCWVQFEHRVPSDNHTYHYPADHTTGIGGLEFVYDVKGSPDFASDLKADPASDGAAISRLAERSNMKFPRRAARIRMFHLPTPDRRSELMIIYGEALPEDPAVPLRKEGVDLMKDSPAYALRLLEDLKSQLTIRTR